MTKTIPDRCPPAAPAFLLAFGLLLASLTVAPSAAAHPLTAVPPSTFVCHFSTEPGAGGRVNGAPAPAATDDGCPYGVSASYAGKTVGFHNNDATGAAHIVTVYELVASPPAAGLPLYSACVLYSLTGYDTPPEGSTFPSDPAVAPSPYMFKIKPGMTYLIEWSNVIVPTSCVTPVVSQVPAKVVLLVPRNADVPHCVADPGGIAFGVNPTIGNLLGNFDELCIGPHKGCDGLQRNLHDGAGRLIGRQYVDVCTVDGAYVCQGEEWYYYNPGNGGHGMGDNSGSIMPADWTADQPTGYAGSGWSETCAGVLGTCAGVWYRYGNDYPGGSGKQSYFEWDRETVPHACV
jgi:hypothetical protein